MSDDTAAPSLVTLETSDPPSGRGRRAPSWPERVGRALNPLPWPVGENLLVCLGVLDGLVRPARLRRALDWAAAQPRGRHGRWGLALRLLANHGRFIAQENLVGVRDLATLRDRIRVTGEEHLVARRGATMLLGFHVGPPGASLALRVLGHPVTSMHDLIYHPSEGSEPSRRTGWRAAGPPARKESANSAVALHRARRHLAAQGCLYITVDGPAGAEAYRMPLPGGPVILRKGWLTLRRLTGAVALPLLAHREGHRRIITVYPPLPAVSPDPRVDAETCGAVLTDLLGGYLRHFPEQCRATLWRP